MNRGWEHTVLMFVVGSARYSEAGLLGGALFHLVPRGKAETCPGQRVRLVVSETRRDWTGSCMGLEG
jgi:hypothetical protein